MDELDNNQNSSETENPDETNKVNIQPESPAEPISPSSEQIKNTDVTASQHYDETPPQDDYYKQESYYDTHPIPQPVNINQPPYQQQYNTPYNNQYPASYPQQQYGQVPHPQNYRQPVYQQNVNPYQQQARPTQPVPPAYPYQTPKYSAANNGGGNLPPVNNNNQAATAATAPPKKDKPAMIIAIVLVSLLVLSIIALVIILSLDFKDNPLDAVGSINISSSDDNSSQSSDDSAVIKLPTNDKPQITTTPASQPDGTYTPQEIYKMVCPAVVGVTIYGDGGALDQLGNASGIIISEDGYIITNAHVVEGAVSQKVTLADEKEFVAEVVGRDVKTDLAVLKIDPGDYKLTVATLGNSGQLEIGEQVFAIGNPAGFTNSLTGGYVSGVDRDFLSPDGYHINCIQTDAALNPGNSGGPLINVYGQVVGVNAFGYVGSTGDYQNINFAIAINDAMPVINDIINNGYVTGRIKIGIVFNELTPVTAQMYDVVPGLYIQEIDSACDIANTELKPYDIITELNGKSVYDVATVEEALKGKKPGDTVTAKVYRKTITNQVSEFTISFKLEELNN